MGCGQFPSSPAHRTRDAKFFNTKLNSTQYQLQLGWIFALATGPIGSLYMMPHAWPVSHEPIEGSLAWNFELSQLSWEYGLGAVNFLCQKHFFKTECNELWKENIKLSEKHLTQIKLQPVSVILSCCYSNIFCSCGIAKIFHNNLSPKFITNRLG